MENSYKPQVLESFSKQKKGFLSKMSIVEEIARTKFIMVVAANTLDATIGKGCIADVECVRQTFGSLSSEMNFNFLELVIEGADYGKKNIINAIDLLEPGSNDIVLFYYSGHGFSYEEDADKKYPQVDLRTPDASDKIDIVNAHTENLADIFERVKSRGARLNIVIGDCCNSLINFKRVFGRVVPVRPHKEDKKPLNKKTVEALFCDYTASILVGSADKGLYAVSDDNIGSLFTYNLSKGLRRLMKQEIDTNAGLPWSKLLKQSTNKTYKLSQQYDIGGGVPGNQKAIYNIEFRATLY